MGRLNFGARVIRIVKVELDCVSDAMDIYLHGHVRLDRQLEAVSQKRV